MCSEFNFTFPYAPYAPVRGRTGPIIQYPYIDRGVRGLLSSIQYPYIDRGVRGRTGAYGGVRGRTGAYGAYKLWKI